MLGGENLREKDLFYLVLVLFSASRYNFPQQKNCYMFFSA